MKNSLQLDVRQIGSLEMQLICNCCGQPYYPDKAWEDKVQAIIFGTEEYAMCPLCTQAVPEDVLHDEGYRQRCRYKRKRLQEVFGSKDAAAANSEKAEVQPTYDELRAKIERLERISRSSLQFRVSERGAVSVYGLGRYPVTLYYEQWVRLLDSAEALRAFVEANKPRLKKRNST